MIFLLWKNIFRYNNFEASKYKLMELNESKIVRILPPQFEQKLALIPFTTGIIKKKSTNQFIALLRKNSLLSDRFNYLKKIKHRDEEHSIVLLCPKKERQQFISLFPKDLLSLIIVQQQVQVPEKAPMTHEQFTLWSQYWPINFMIREQIKQKKLSKQFVNFLKEAQKKAKFQIPVFNQQGKILYVCQQKNRIKNQKMCSKGTIKHRIMHLLEQWSLCEEFKSAKSDYYFLTNLNLFLGQSICSMCSMALVHSRVQSLYFDSKVIFDKQNFSMMRKIMQNNKLNHKIGLYELKKQTLK